MLVCTLHDCAWESRQHQPSAACRVGECICARAPGRRSLNPDCPAHAWIIRRALGTDIDQDARLERAHVRLGQLAVFCLWIALLIVIGWLAVEYVPPLVLER